MTTMSPVVHFEMPAEDGKCMASFYENALGWKTQMLGPDMGDYVLVTTAESDVKPGAPARAINGGFFPKKPDWPAQYPSIVIGVDDVDSAMKRVVQASGKVLGERGNIEDSPFSPHLLARAAKDHTPCCISISQARTICAIQPQGSPS
jgi:uncharacterized protein